MHGKINVAITMNLGFNFEKSVNMKALLKVKNPEFEGTNYGVMEIVPKHPIKPNTAVSLALSQGKVFKVEASVGQAVKKGDAVVILEAMKMEIPVVAPEDGTVASIDVAVGDPVEAGATLATLN